MRSITRRSRRSIELCRFLRREQTEAEARLWSLLRNRGVMGAKFRRQHPLGPYVVDFFCPFCALVVEVDGDIHLVPGAQQADAERERWLRAAGCRVVRVANDEVLEDLDGVRRKIEAALLTPDPSSPPTPLQLDAGEGSSRIDPIERWRGEQLD